MSIHPILRLVATHPHLLADHVEAYAALVDEEVAAALSFWRGRALMNGIALLLLLVAAILGGVAVMLWMVVPPSSIGPSWGLVAVPLAPLLLALMCLLLRRRAPSSMFADVKQQLATDFRMLRGASLPARTTPP